METKTQSVRHYAAKRSFVPGAAVLCGICTGFFPAARLAFADDAAAKAVDRGLAFLAAHQHDGGSYGTDVYRGHVAVTAFVSRAMMAAGSKPGEGTYGQHLSKSVHYLLGRVQPDGLIISQDKNEPAPMYGHAYALAFLADCQKQSPNDEVKEKIQRAVDLTVKSQNKQGGWRYLPKPGEADVSVTVTQLMALLAARDAGADVPKESIERAIGYIKKSQNPDGGFRYVLYGGTSGFARSAAAVAALYRAGADGDRDNVRKGFAFIAKHAAADTVGQPEVFYFYGHYYAAQVMRHATAADWRRWSAAVNQKLIEQQSADGSWPDTASIELGTAMACLTLQTKK
jgi:prenyltransferase beta subunit